ncbi:telomere zinc finger-associated protein isoform X2 [Oryzias melastigma]|uniref:telomere zinc finger-associated protein isoform X2 n=1 Tax=Oryzias melastigma TaxID=30732 RepID=UPI000CF835AE|nr:telomere zinc finger-associated protein isoform X2 [Oryzias melastigma]
MPAAENTHARRVLSSLNQQRATGRFCDAVLNLGEGELYLAHHSILACFSELFKPCDNPSSLSIEVSLNGCPGDGLQLLLNFIYTGHLKLDHDNLERVQQAASSLCVPEVLALCRQFRESSVELVKRRRGRPRKSAPETSRALKEEELLPSASEDVSSLDFATGTHATTTRSGRVVKGPKRLVSDGSPDSEHMMVTAVDEEAADDLHPATAETQEEVLQLDVHRSSEDEEDAEDFECVDIDTDEEYIPVSDPTPSTQPVAKNPKVESKASVDAVEDDSRTDSVSCDTCHKSFKSKYYLKVHNRRHTGEKPFTCLKCDKKYLRKESLFLHETRGCPTVQCLTCQEQFMYKNNLNMHMMKVHGHPKPHACSQCPKTFLTRTVLKVHEATRHRGEKPFVCEECGHRASSRNGLQMHIKAIHRNERPFVCNLCGHAFSQKNNLNMHLRIHSDERPFQCHLCGKTFRTQASLDKHNRTHTGERPFTCDVCEKSFTEKGALLRHKASKHEEGRPHCCHICGKTFKAKEQMRVHLRRHKGVRSFECIDCGYKFTRQAHLRRHTLIHKRTENYNPRQRKLRSIIIQDDGDAASPKEAPSAVDASSETAAAHDSTDLVSDLTSIRIVTVE